MRGFVTPEPAEGADAVKAAAGEPAARDVSGSSVSVAGELAARDTGESGGGAVGESGPSVAGDAKRGSVEDAETLRVRRRSRVVTLVTLGIVIVLTPLTLWLFGVFARGQYYLASVLIIIYTMVPFFTAFESRRPQARELVIIAVMGAICVAARAAFFWLPQFKPMAALVMIGGIAFGAQAGFLTGAISLFVSNFLFGQGPWTPFQMFGYGLTGFLAGVCADRGIIARGGYGKGKLVVLSLCAGMFVIGVLGPILDTATLFTMMSTVNLQTATAVYLSGVPFNAMQAAATTLTFLLVGNPLLRKFDRVRTKYGLLDP